ncbi:hypothetical protein K24_16500, partial [Klebsiella pneumoniae]
SFHVYPYHIGYLLPGSSVLQHSATCFTMFGFRYQTDTSIPMRADIITYMRNILKNSIEYYILIH